VIEQTKAIDNHAHPRPPHARFHKDRDFDALPVDNMEPESRRGRAAPRFSALADALGRRFSALTGHLPLDANQLSALNQARARVRQQRGENYSNWSFDQADIETMAANRVSMDAEVRPPRFRWVLMPDALLFPLDNSGRRTIARSQSLLRR